MVRAQKRHAVRCEILFLIIVQAHRPQLFRFKQRHFDLGPEKIEIVNTRSRGPRLQV